MKRIFFCLLLLLPFMSNAQQLLTLRNAIDTALKNNFDIRIARNNAEIGKINNTFGVAGGLPVIAANAGDNGSVNNINEKLSDGTTPSTTNATSNLINAGVMANMTLFNGFKIIATKERLSCLQQQSELLLNQQIQTSVADIMLKYYDIIRQESYLKIIQNSLDVSNKKLDIINEKDKVGMATAVDKLQAQMDVNSAEQNLKLQQTVVDQDKDDLLLLICAKHFGSFIVNDSMVVDSTIVMDSITNFLGRNPSYLSAEQEIKINEQIIKEISAQRYPSLKLDAGYNYAYDHYTFSSPRMYQAYGPVAGLTLQIPIYDGNAYRIQKKTAEYNLANVTLEKESLLSNLKGSAIKTYLAYSTSLKQLDEQKVNYQSAKKLVAVVLQNFQVNQATILDVKAAESTFEDAAYLLVNFQYSAKTAEIELKQLVYKLKY